ncbi:DNA polymerase [Bacillus sp. ISL-57]|uniref:DNA polymerase n=1 Tax=Bacillus sp. ISL-57 TaxID=2819135 RepID=UPI001BEA2B5D|nr:DNA polymerase [Bacillus sp. ISL-57]MBT2718063.1 DNA polymerase [Bacillus sp. ISL-57]
MAGKKQKKEDKKPVKIFTLDTETRGLFGDIFRVGMYDGEKYFVSNTFKEIKNILSKYTINYDCHIFIHNLDFDLSKMATELIPTVDLNKSIFINNNVTVFQASITTAQHTEENDIITQPITLHDSNKIILGRLKKICKDFGLDSNQSKIELKDHILKLGWGRNKKGEPIKNKSEYDEFESEGYYFMNVDPWEKELNEYLRMDCVSLYEVITTLINISELPIHEFLKCPTTASLAMKVFQINYPEDYEKACSTNYYGVTGEKNEAFIRNSYCGGRTEVFTPYLEQGYHYDVNSLYPYVMKNFPIPYGKPTMYMGDKARQMFKYWYNFGQGAGFMEIDIHIPDTLHIPPLPAKRNNKLIFPVGNLHGTWTFEEIKVALEMGCKINKIYQCLFFDKVDFIFKDFIAYYEKIKTTSEGAKKTFAKLMQNSLYGKFGMRRLRRSLLPIEELDKCKERYRTKGYRYIVLNNPLIEGDEFIEADIASHAPYIQPHIAAYVTSLARIVLYKGIMEQLDKGQVAYCDTDSVACKAMMDDELVDDKEYGKWKLESEVVEGIFLQPKTYWEKHGELEEDAEGNLMNKETKKFKGIPKRKMEDVTVDTYRQIFGKLQDIQRREEAGEKIPKEEAYFPLYLKAEKKRFKFATNLKNGQTNFDDDFEVTKGIILTNSQKRKMDYINNTSTPHKLNEWSVQ